MRLASLKQARQMRSEPKWSEDRLWQALRDQRCGGLKFRRQARIGPYIADFLCFHPRLIIEIDGGIHKLREERDAVRDAWLQAQGFRVFHFKPEACVAPEGIITAILEAAGLSSQAAGPGTSSPPARSGRAGRS